MQQEYPSVSGDKSKLSENSSGRQSGEGAVEKPEAAVVEAQNQQAVPSPHETELFPPPAEPRYFGTGSYATGGSTTEGNYAIRDLNPLGGYGSFTDAGGPGSTTLLGEEEHEPEPSKSAGEKAPKS
jgi:hypothetical protein